MILENVQEFGAAGPLGMRRHADSFAQLAGHRRSQHPEVISPPTTIFPLDDGHSLSLLFHPPISLKIDDSFMGGTNFWGGNKEDDCFIAPSFDDRVLEVVAVFGSVQMAASRIINLQHHRIAQCHSVKITILGDEGVPVQVDGEAWLQPPGLIRIVHKNRMQMLCRNRVLPDHKKKQKNI